MAMPKKIVIIDDEANFCKLVKNNLEQTGEFVVAMALNARDGIALAKKIKPDLILMDIIMPEVDGGEAISWIKNDSVLRNTPVIFLSAIITEDDVSHSRGVISGYPVLSKTAKVDEVISCINDNIRSG